MYKLSRMIIVIALLSLSSQLWAHGGVVSMGNECRLLVGPFTLNFSGYQPQNNQSEQFCDDLPVVGESIIVLDFVDRKLREMTVNFRVIKADGPPLGTEEDGKVKEAELAETPLFEIPAKHYPNGIMTINQHFTEKGHFVGYVIVENGDEKFISRFPFSVGYPKSGILDMFSNPFVVVAFILMLLSMILFISKKWDEKKKVSEG
ncbi:MAG: hypothetical protein A6F70_08975 [Cycloclasticus sp. symbiont of Bathymodiolus heckerae]|nr:MAG: hypothetical protein A6F70_08975 [Cycloclasticus sp. symbiont of Bathymodiolus heckerae]